MVGRACKLFAALLRKLRTAAGLPLSMLAMVMVVWVLLWPARILVLSVPLRRLARFYGIDHGAKVAIPAASDGEERRAASVRDAIALAVRYSPSSANCYPQALVARMVLRLRRIPHGLFFGLRRSEEKAEMDAHAWVMVGDVPVSGGYSFDSYTVVRCFTGQPRA